MSGPWHQTVCKAIGLLLFFSFGAGCKNKEAKKQRSTELIIQGSETVIKKDTARFIRGTGGTTGTLSFETNGVMLCELQYWTNDPAVPPTQDQPASAPCGGGQAVEAFTIVLDKLSPVVVYSFSLKLWPPGSSKEEGRLVRIDEKATGKGLDPEIAEIAVARIDLPQQSAEIYTHKLAGTSTVTGLRSQLVRTIKCGNEPDDKPFFEAAAPENNLKFLSTDGFARANASVHPSYPNRMLLVFDTPQHALNLDWTFQWKDKQLDFNSQPPGYMDTFHIVANERLRVRGKDLSAQLEQFNVAGAGSLAFEWVPKNYTVTSYLIVKMKGATTNHFVECSFPGSTGNAKVPDDIFKKMPNDKYNFLAIFETIQLHYRQDGVFPTWVIKSQDWRFANVTKI